MFFHIISAGTMIEAQERFQKLEDLYSEFDILNVGNKAKLAKFKNEDIERLSILFRPADVF